MIPRIENYGLSDSFYCWLRLETHETPERERDHLDVGAMVGAFLDSFKDKVLDKDATNGLPPAFGLLHRGWLEALFTLRLRLVFINF